MSSLRKGQKVRVTASTSHPKFNPESHYKDLEGKVGTVTGRTLQGFVEVNIYVESFDRMFGCLLSPDGLEAAK